MAGRGRFWCGAVSKNSPSTPTISVTLPPGKTRWRRLSEWPANAGKSSNALRLPRANADWITTRFATGKVGTGTSRWPCWPMLCCRCCAPAEKKTPNAQVRLGVPELRHLLTALLWRGWHGIEHLLHWPLAKTSSIPRHDMPLSKAGSNSVFLLSTTVVLGRIYEDARRNRLTNHSLIAGPVAALRAHADHFLELAEWFDSFQHMDEIEQAFASAREEKRLGEVYDLSQVQCAESPTRGHSVQISQLSRQAH